MPAIHVHVHMHGADSDLVTHHSSMLEHHLGKPTFHEHAEHARKQLSTAEHMQLAKHFTGYRATSGKHASELIHERHNSLVTALKKERATGGRGAA